MGRGIITTEKKYITIEEFFEDVLEDRDCRVFQFKPLQIWGKTAKQGARAKIFIPTEICGEDIRDLRKWNLFCVAVPIEVEEG